MSDPAARFPTDRFRSLIELTADWYWEQDADLRFCLYEGGSRNHRWRSVQNASLGQRRWELPGVQLHLSDWDAHRADLAARRAFLDFEFARRLPNGQLFWVSVSGHPLFDRRGEFTGYRGLARDITARKETERAFAESQMFLDKAGQIAGVGAWQIDIESGRVSWSRQTRLLHEVDETFVPTLRNAFDFYPPAARERVRESVERSIARGEHWKIEVPFITAKGRERWVRVSGEAECEQGRVIRLIGGFQDVTEIHAALVAAEAASRSKSAFLANMSHEIRTPLNAVLGMLQLLGNTGLDDRQADYAGKAQTAARSLLGLLNDILDLSRVEAGKLPVDSHPFETRKLFRNLSAILAASLGERPVELLFDIDPSIPDVLEGDLLRLQQVLVNLGGNAVKFTPQGEVRLQVSVQARSEQSVRLLFAVQDTGVGIAPEQQEMIFEGFTQAETSTNRRFGGSGLGLAISRRLVELMGGALRVNSALGQGSTFFFSLDFKIADHSRVSPNAAGSATEATRASAPIPSRRVLVIEPHVGQRQVLDGLLHALGWPMLLAANLNEALALLAQGSEPVDVVILDAALASVLPASELERLWAEPRVERAGVVVLQQASQDPTWTALKHAGRFIASWLKPITRCMFEELSHALEVAERSAADAISSPAVGALALQGVRILLVEDNAINQQLAVELLQQQGAVVEVAVHGQAALDRLAQTSGVTFDCVLMDIQMPIMDGYTAARRIRQDPRLARLPILAMTANALPSDREAALAAGMNDHIAKPFELQDLISRIQTHLTPRAEPEERLQTTPRAESEERPQTTPRAEPEVRPQTTLHAEPEAPPSALAPDASLGTEPARSNVHQALARIGGDRLLLTRMWLRFHAELEELIRAAQQARGQEPSLEEWARHAHTVKGVAATLGLTELAAVATETDRALKRAAMELQPSNDWLDWIDRLRHACEEAQIEIKRLCAEWETESKPAAGLAPTEQSPGSPTPTRDLQALGSIQSQSDAGAWQGSRGGSSEVPAGVASLSDCLRQVHALLLDHNLDVLVLIEHPNFAALRADPTWMTGIVPAIEALEFDRAQTLLEHYLTTWESPNE